MSGDSDSGGYKYMAIVIGTEEKVSSVAKKLGSPIHMREIASRKKKISLVSMLEFDRKEVIAYCIKVNRDKAALKISKLRKSRKKNIPYSRIIRAHNRLLLRRLRGPIEEFTVMHGCNVAELAFQCDSDCESFLKDNGLNYVDGGAAHELSDMTAWGNNAGREPRGTVALDLEDELVDDWKKAK